MKRFTSMVGLVAVVLGWAGTAAAESITSLDGKSYADVRNVVLRPGGLFFVIGSGEATKGVTIPYTNLTEAVQEKYHCTPYDQSLAYARQNQLIIMSKQMAFSLSQLEEAKKKAKAENKLMGFIMVWDSMFMRCKPMEEGSNSGLAHFYEVFNKNLVLVFVRHENELSNVPSAVGQGFFGPDEGGFAPNMAVVSSDCSEYICEIPYGGNDSNGQIREKIFREKIAVIKDWVKKHEKAK